MVSNNRHSDQGEAGALRELFGPMFPKLVGSLGGARIYVPVKPNRAFINFCGEDIARVFLLKMPGDTVRVPTSELYCFDLRQKAVLQCYSDGIARNQISKQLSLSQRCVSDIISLTMADPAIFAPVQRARIIALAKKGVSTSRIAREVQCEEGFVRKSLAHAHQSVRKPVQPHRLNMSGEFKQRVCDLFNQGLPLNDIAETLDCDVRDVKTAVAGRRVCIGQNLPSLDLLSRVRILWDAGMSDLDIAIECVGTLAETHRQLALCGIVAGCAADAIKSDGHLTRAAAGSATAPLPGIQSQHFAAVAASY